MSQNETPSEPTATNSSDGTACATRACCPLQGRWGLLLWVLLIGAIVVVQWPMLKGWYYKATNAQAPTSAVAWRTGFDAALAESAKTGKPVLVDFTASWCPPCQVMKHEVWPDGRVASAVNDGYVPVLVDVDDPKNADVAQRYGIRSIPTLVVVDAAGRVVRQGAFMSAGDLLDFLKPGA
jgi:thiol:disulfide interchange protein